MIRRPGVTRQTPGARNRRDYFDSKPQVRRYLAERGISPGDGGRAPLLRRNSSGATEAANTLAQITALRDATSSAAAAGGTELGTERSARAASEESVESVSTAATESPPADNSPQGAAIREEGEQQEEQLPEAGAARQPSDSATGDAGSDRRAVTSAAVDSSTEPGDDSAQSTGAEAGEKEARAAALAEMAAEEPAAAGVEGGAVAAEQSGAGQEADGEDEAQANDAAAAQAAVAPQSQAAEAEVEAAKEAEASAQASASAHAEAEVEEPAWSRVEPPPSPPEEGEAHAREHGAQTVGAGVTVAQADSVAPPSAEPPAPSAGVVGPAVAAPQAAVGDAPAQPGAPGPTDGSSVLGRCVTTHF